MSGGSAAADAAAVAVLDYDRLACQLMECAILVKKGERRNPLLRQTVHDLTDYLTTTPPSSNGATSGTARPAPASSTKPSSGGGHHRKTPSVGSTSSQGKEQSAAASSSGKQSSPTTLSKPSTKPPAHLGQVFSKVMGGLGLDEPEDIGSSSRRSESSKAATSSKNAARAKADIAAAAAANANSSTGGGSGVSSLSHAAEAVTGWLTGHHAHAEEPEWCEEHFAMGCACKARGGKKDGGAATSKPASSSSSSSNRPRSKPAFQRPVNPKSSLIANGWLEQQRRSKMRTVWKEVLASLVEGRRRGEETTLWIQRQITNSTTGKSELEALHQIPVKWLEHVQYNEYSTDHRFTLKVYHLSDEFIFRCKDEEAAQNWVLTLRSVQQISQQKKTVRTGVDDWDKTQPGTATAPSSQRQQKHPPLTSGPAAATASANNSAAAARSGTPSQQQPHRQPAAAATTTTTITASFDEEKKSDTSATGAQQQGGSSHRMAISELRAIAHGAGFPTKGMERGELEAVVARIGASQGSSPVPPLSPKPAAASKPPHQQPSQEAPSFDEGDRRRKEQQQINEDAEQYAEELRQRQSAEEDAERQRLLAERVAMERRKREEEEAAARARQEEAERQRLIAERVREQQALEKQRRDEQERRRLEAERLRRDEEEMRRRLAERQAEEQRRKQEEAQRLQQQQWQQQQQAWHQQQAEEAQRKKAAEMQAEQARKQQEEAYRRQQQWQQQQQKQKHAQQQTPHSGYPQQNPGAYGPQQTAQVPPGGSAHSHPHAQTAHPQQHQPGFGAAPQGRPQAQPQHFPGTAPHPQHPHSAGQPPPQQKPQRQGSAVNMKYAKMAQQTDDNGQGQQALMTQIKHGILIEWALLPPMLQVLRPIDVLLTSVHTVFPPKFGVPGHEYFGKWTPIKQDEISQGPALGNHPDEAKLKKSMRKLRFFLHPDKLPRDLSQEQTFMCKMLWDIISDAEAEYKKKEEELGWIRG